MVQYAIDFSHSSITFSIKHMMISNVKGTFDSYTADIKATSIESLSNANIHIEIDVASISTKDYARDNHLISAEFFHADLFPKITFTMTNIELIEDNLYHMTGDLTIKGVTKSVVFITKYTGHVKSPWGQEKFGFSAQTQINRREFNLLYNAALETGGVLIGENVDVLVDLELHPQ